MTNIQLTYQANLEMERSNRSREAETQRHNTVTEGIQRDQTNADIVYKRKMAAETERANRAREFENAKANAEIARANRMREQQTWASIAETQRKNSMDYEVGSRNARASERRASAAERDAATRDRQETNTDYWRARNYELDQIGMAKDILKLIPDFAAASAPSASSYAPSYSGTYRGASMPTAGRQLYPGTPQLQLPAGAN